MVEYICENCNKKYHNKYDYNRHLNRKIPCKSDRQENNKKHDVLQKPAELLQYPAKNELTDLAKELQCKYCNQMFTRKDNLHKHVSERCKIKKQQDNQKEDLLQKLIKETAEMKEEIKKNNQEIKKKDNQVANLETELNKLKSGTKTNVKQIGKQQKNNIIQNIENQQNNIITNNIKLLAFGKEDMTHIVDELYKKILNKGFKSVPTLVEHVHFNKNKPENHNIYISNIRTNYVLIYDGIDWKLKEKDDILQQLMDDKTAILSDKFDELLTELDEPSIKKFQRFLDNQDENSVITGIKNDLKLMLYNNRKIPEMTRELINSTNENKKMLKVV